MQFRFGGDSFYWFTFHIGFPLPPTTLTFNGAVRRCKKPAKTFSMTFSSSSHYLLPLSLFSTEATGAVVSMSEKIIDLLHQNIIPGCMIRNTEAVHEAIKFRPS